MPKVAGLNVRCGVCGQHTAMTVKRAAGPEMQAPFSKLSCGHPFERAITAVTGLVDEETGTWEPYGREAK